MQRVVWALLLCFAAHCVSATPPTEADAQKFLSDFDTRVRSFSRAQNLASWAYETNITTSTMDAMTAVEGEFSNFIAEVLVNATDYINAIGQFSNETNRLLQKLRLYGGEPKNATLRDDLHSIAASMSATYSTGKVTVPGFSEPQLLDPGLTDIMANNRDYDVLLAAWKGWHDVVGVPLKERYTKFVGLSNQGARDYNFPDTSALWLAGYDMPPEDFKQEVEGLWNELLPFYTELHCYVRAKLGDFYGAERVPQDQPIPAHLLGNMWAQSWLNIYDLVEPYKGVAPLDVTPFLKQQNYTASRMMDLGRQFYTSIGLPDLPSTFERSMIVRPSDNTSVVCHASAWDLGFNETANAEDLRIKMCTSVNQEDLFVIHHELGHLFYDQEYDSAQSKYLFRDGANDGFHEAIGDTIMLSVNVPSHLAAVNLLDSASAQLSQEGLINYQMRVALDKIAFIPFGYLVDLWRWEVFSGQVTPENYNTAWWDLREKYQGVRSAVFRDPSSSFDPGAKFHVAANVPYMRYFLALVLQFQFHEALCKVAQPSQDLYNCSIYNNKDAGARFRSMLQMGTSKPWQEALKSLTGTEKMSAQPILRYFKPLIEWLKTNNGDRKCGFTVDDSNENVTKKAAIAVAVSIVGVLIVAIAVAVYRQSHHGMNSSSFSPLVDDTDPMDTEGDSDRTAFNQLPIGRASRQTWTRVASENDGL